MTRIMQATTLAGVLATINVATALPPEIGWTSRENAFFAHLDVERIAGSVLSPILDEPFRVDDDDQVWRKLADELPLKLGEDVRSITLLDVGPLERDLVCIVRMSERADRVPQVMAEHVPGYRQAEMDGYTVHSWAEMVEGERRYIYGHIRPISDSERMCLISTSWEHLLDTLAFADGAKPVTAVFDGTDGPMPPLAESALYAYIPSSSFLGDHDAARPHLEKVQWIAIDVGATDQQCTIRIAGGMRKAEEATEVAQMAQGLLAFGRMMLRDNESMKPVLRLIDQTRIAAKESRVMIELDAQPDMFAEALNAVKLQVSAARQESGRFSFQMGAQMKDSQAPEE